MNNGISVTQQHCVANGVNRTQMTIVCGWLSIAVTLGWGSHTTGIQVMEPNVAPHEISQGSKHSRVDKSADVTTKIAGEEI